MTPTQAQALAALDELQKLVSDFAGLKTLRAFIEAQPVPGQPDARDAGFNNIVQRERALSAAQIYIDASAGLTQAMQDGINVHGALGRVIAAEDELRAAMNTTEPKP